MTENAAPENLTYFLEWRQTGDWQYTCTLPAWIRWPFRKEDGAWEWLWQMDSHLWVRAGDSDISWEDDEYDTEAGEWPRDFIFMVNENNTAWLRLSAPSWRCQVDFGQAGTHPDFAGFVISGDEGIPFTAYAEMEQLLWRSMQDHFRAALDVDEPQDDMAIMGHERESDWQWCRGWIDAEFRRRARLPGRREQRTGAGPIRFTIYRGSDGHWYFTHELQACDTIGIEMQAVLTAEISVEGAFSRDDRLFLPVPGKRGLAGTYESISGWGVMTGALDSLEKAGLCRVLWSEGMEHPYTHLLRHATRCGIWSEFLEAGGVARQIPYTEIAKVLYHMVPDGEGHICRPTGKNVGEYFKSQGYRTARSRKVSVDELIERLGQGSE